MTDDSTIVKDVQGDAIQLIDVIVSIEYVFESRGIRKFQKC